MALTKVIGQGIDNITVDSSGIDVTCAAGAANVALQAYHPTSTSARDIAKFQSNVGGTQQDKVVIQCDGTILGPPSANFVIKTGSGTGDMQFHANGSQRAMVGADGKFYSGKSVTALGTAGVLLGNEGSQFVRDSGTVVDVNREGSDGRLFTFYNDTVDSGSISVSGTTVSYNGGHLSRWGQTTDGQPIAGLVKGTVMTNLDQMAVWEKDGVAEDNEQLNCLAVSSVEGDANVAGVFVNYDGDDPNYPNDINLAMTGDMIIRIASGTTVARGDLLMSAGDGTAKPQGDDIVRSKTIAKVTSANVSHTYDDGSYCVPCVLMAC